MRACAHVLACVCEAIRTTCAGTRVGQGGKLDTIQTPRQVMMDRLRRRQEGLEGHDDQEGDDHQRECTDMAEADWDTDSEDTGPREEEEAEE